MDLKGKNLIYIGGFGGIGEKCVEAFLEKSVKNLLVFDLNPNQQLLETWKNTYKNSYVDFVPIDLTKCETIEKAFKQAKAKIGHFDVLINGSGVFNEYNVEHTVNVNLIGLIHSSQIAMDYMSKAKGGTGGCIVNISSIAGLDPIGVTAIYSATKSAVITFSRCWASPINFVRTGISFITVCPGATSTPIVKNIDSKINVDDYGMEIVRAIENCEYQSADDCAKNLISILETAQNGSIWAIENGLCQEVKIPQLWHPII